MTELNSPKNSGCNPNNRILLLLSIMGISFSLRAPITSIGPLAGLIHADLFVSNGFIGFITTLPLIAFSICSPVIPRISGRIGIGRTMLFGLVLIVVGGVIRSYTGIAGLLLGTALIGVGISGANVLIPSIVKLKYPDRIGVVTSIYITSMAIFASLGAGVSYPLAETGLGWESASVVWSLVALCAFFAWLPQNNLGAREKNASHFVKDRDGHRIWKSPLAWYITLFFGLQSLNFYSLTAWVPSILQENGMAPVTAGYMALWFQLIGIPSSFATPILAAKVKSQRTIVAGSCAAYFIGISMLMVFHSTAAVLIALLFLSNGGSASFSWALTMFSLKTKDANEAVELSGMSQSLGYLLAATGPTLCGVIFDAAGKWSPVLGLFLGVTVVMVVTGILAAKKEKLFQ